MSFLKKQTPLFLLTLVFFFSCAYYNSLFNAKKSYKDGIDAILNSPDPSKTPSNAKKYFETTIEKSWKLIGIYGDDSKWADDALLYIAKSEYHLEKYTQAKVHLEQFQSKYPKSNLMYESYLWYGKAVLKLGDYEIANEYFLKAINNSKKAEIRAEAFFELGYYDYENESYGKAQEYFQKALSEKPSKQYRASLQFYLGETFYIQKDYDNAIKQYKKVEKYSPTLDIEYLTGAHMAKSYAFNGKYASGIKILRKMLTAPRFKNFVPSIKTTIGEIYAMGGRYEDAIDIYMETVSEGKKTPGTAQASLNLARLYENVYREIDSAIVYYGLVSSLYNKFDSVEVAKDKKTFLSELMEIQDAIDYDEMLIYRLTNDEDFRDSLYKAQYEDSLRRLYGDTLYAENEEPELGPDPFFIDTLQNVFGDTLAQTDQEETEQEETEQPPESLFGNEQEEESEGITPLEQNLQETLLQQNQNNNQQQETEEKPKIVEVERRKLSEIENDLMSHRFQIAEYYLLKVEDYDSAKVYFNRFVETYSDTLLTPKVLYSLRLIYSQEGHLDSQAVKSMENEILTNYPESIFARQILKEKGLYTEEKTMGKTDGISHQLFLEAEALYADRRFNEALNSYQRIADNDTISQWGVKSLYAKAWIYEHDLGETDSAYATYEEIVRRYPNAWSYIAIAKNKTSPIDTETPGQTAGLDSIETLATVNDTTKEVSLIAGAAVVNGKVAEEVHDQLIDPDKIRWRTNRFKGSNKNLLER